MVPLSPIELINHNDSTTTLESCNESLLIHSHHLPPTPESLPSDFSEICQNVSEFEEVLREAPFDDPFDLPDAGEPPLPIVTFNGNSHLARHSNYEDVYSSDRNVLIYFK